MRLPVPSMNCAPPSPGSRHEGPGRRRESRPSGCPRGSTTPHPPAWRSLLLTTLALSPLPFLPGNANHPPSIRLFKLHSLTNWSGHTNAGAIQWTSPIQRPGFAWDEAVPSWNVARNSSWTVELRAIGAGQPETWYPLGHWCSDTNHGSRTSWTGGSFPGGKVLTDTLRVEQPAEGVQVRLTGRAATRATDFRLFTVSLTDSRADGTELEAFRPAWGRSLAVPAFSQADYPEGINSWCSPTSVTMLMAWWLGQAGQVDATPGVRETAHGVFDPGWPGTGNWAFNMAYVGQFPGLRSAVARLADLPDLERWIHAGFPVAASVSYGLLKGGSAAQPGDGHLVVVRGFTAEGNVLVHDPGVRLSRVAREIPRDDFRAAWRHSRNTTYLVWPEDRSLPEGGDGRW